MRRASGNSPRPTKTSTAFSTLFTAQQVRDHLGKAGGIAAAIEWCKKTAVTKVYVEAFRDGYQADRDALLDAQERFRTPGSKSPVA